MQGTNYIWPKLKNHQKNIESVQILLKLKIKIVKKTNDKCA